jgi:16S rRNA (adenine(1408)-N(1))-methyltransferase
MAARYEQRVTIDLGTGDGRAVLRMAREHPDRLFIGIDANRDGLVEASQRALRKPARGGAENALFVQAPVEALPCELDGVADRVVVILPWGSLLRAVLLPDIEVLAGICCLCRPGATFEAIVSLDLDRDAGQLARLGLSAGAEHLAMGSLRPAYGEAGFRLRSVEPLTHAELAGVPSTWARKLARNPDRQAWRIEGSAEEPPAS